MQLGYDKTDYDGGIVVGLNTQKHKTLEQLTRAKEKAQQDYQRKFGREWFFNTDGRATSFHEMGHCFYDVHATSTQWKASGKTEEWGRIADAWAAKSQCDILKSHEEAFAEAWAAYHTHGRELPDDVRDFIKGLK